MMSKPQKLSSLQFEDLPDEMILKILRNLDMKDVLHCGLVSNRIRTISRDESLWERINLYNKIFPAEFVQLALNSGCKYLSLEEAKLVHGKEKLHLTKPSKLRYLNLAACTSHPSDIEEILGSCNSLEKLKLSAEYTSVTPNMIRSISEQNSQTLELLSLSCSLGHQQILEKCTELKELTLGKLSGETLNFVENNLPTSIEKLKIFRSQISDQFVITLVTRCKNLKSLDLSGSKGITNNAVTTIIGHLKDSLEELDLTFTNGMTLAPITLSKLLELKAMPKLKVFQCATLKDDEIRNLSNNLPHLMQPIKTLEDNERDLLNFSTNMDQIWDIKAKQLKIFRQRDQIYD